MIGAVSAGVSRKSIDRNFETITTGLYNRDYSEDNAYFNFDGLKVRSANILLVKAGISRIGTVTSKVTEKKSNLISLNDEGWVVTYTGYAETNLKLGINLPQFTARYSRSIIESSEIECHVLKTKKCFWERWFTIIRLNLCCFRQISLQKQECQIHIIKFIRLLRLQSHIHF